MDANVLKELRKECLAIARQAGAAIRAISAESMGIENKADGSPVTRADLASHRIIVTALQALAPTLAIISEEGDVEAAAARAGNAYWLVDPLDGTKDFINRLDEYTVNIALVESGQAVLGIIYLPAKDVMYWALTGRGAWKQTKDAEPVRLACSARQAPLVAAVIPLFYCEQTKRLLSALGAREVVFHGGIVNTCIVAEGRAEIHLRPTRMWYWDSAAGTVIAREAGCRVVNLQGGDLTYDLADGLKTPGFIVCQKNTPLANIM